MKDIGEGIVGAFLIGSALLTPFLRQWRNKWGATDAGVDASWLGDDLVPHPKRQWTHAVTIRASAAEVWPWLAQPPGARLRVNMENKAKLQKPEEAL